MTQPIPTAPVAPTPAPAPVVPAGPSRIKKGIDALVSAITSKTAIKLEVALARYVVYAILGAEGIHHAGILGF